MIKLGDFGLAAQLEHSCLKRITLGDASWYMAPEVCDGRTELKSDVWSLGISLIELAEGKNPYAGRTYAAIMEEKVIPKTPSLSSSKWSAEFVDFVSKCLVRDVSERWSVSELMNVSSCISC